MTRVLQGILSGVFFVFAIICGLLVSAARSDFTFRGCQDIPRAEWEATANCADGWLAQLIFGLAGLALMLSALVLWRWRLAS